ncbi:MAG: thioredoxin family protein [Opitutales bacterium]|nr:thioredoxin family protein [Opitutales bacterium]MCH8540503.1 thioredoxin family protein [Opitutales bacterium]
MKTLLTSPLTLLTALFVLAGSLSVHAEEAKPEAVGLIFHADWCGSCKVMDPKIEEARKELGDASVLFVVLDHTDDNTKHQAAMLAQKLGYSEIFNERDGKTGAMLLINTGTGEVVETVTRSDSSESIVEKVQKTLGKS